MPTQHSEVNLCPTGHKIQFTTKPSNDGITLLELSRFITMMAAHLDDSRDLQQNEEVTGDNFHALITSVRAWVNLR
jgi:hypothetical protein